MSSTKTWRPPVKCMPPPSGHSAHRPGITSPSPMTSLMRVAPHSSIRRVRVVGSPRPGSPPAMMVRIAVSDAGRPSASPNRCAAKVANEAVPMNVSTPSRSTIVAIRAGVWPPTHTRVAPMCRTASAYGMPPATSGIPVVRATLLVRRMPAAKNIVAMLCSQACRSASVSPKNTGVPVVPDEASTWTTSAAGTPCRSPRGCSSSAPAWASRRSSLVVNGTSARPRPRPPGRGPARAGGRRRTARSPRAGTGSPAVARAATPAGRTTAASRSRRRSVRQPCR